MPSGGDIHDWLLRLASRMSIMVTLSLASASLSRVQAQSCTNAFVFSGSIGSGDLRQTGRLIRDDEESTCTSAKICPGEYDFESRRFDARSFTNRSFETACVTVELRNTCGTDRLFSAAYWFEFVETDVCANYVADGGYSGLTNIYSFEVAAGDVFVVVVHEKDPNVGCGNYTLIVSGLCTNAPPTNTPPRFMSASVTSTVENGFANLQFSFDDPDPTNSFTVELNWGDGSALSTNAVTNLFSFNATHRYLDDGLTGGPVDAYGVAVTLRDNRGGIAVTNLTVRVTNLPPVLQGVAATSPIIAGTNAILTGAISDAGALDSFMLQVNWGNGQTSNFAFTAGTTNFILSHVYTNAATYMVELTLSDDDGGTNDASACVTAVFGHDPRPRLEVMRGTNNYLLRWPRGCGDFFLQSARDLVPATWATVTNAMIDNGSFSTVEFPPDVGTQFYRLGQH